jgi:ATP-dependent Zn protease
VPARQERSRKDIYDRVKILVMLGVVGCVSAWARTQANPVMSSGESLYISFVSNWWLPVLIGIEAIRQVHYLIAERSTDYSRFWQDRVFGAAGKRGDSMNPWRRFRLQRLWRFLIITIAIGVIFGAFTNRSPLGALTALPGIAWERLPYMLQMLFIVFASVAQFAAIFWFMSKGGVETYNPEDIKTRFSDVWGQDHVIEKVRENIMFLENPELVESAGGYVPSGILLWGPPGTGKTLIAEAVAGETGKPYVFVDPAAFLNMFVGVGPMKVKALFRKLRKLSLRHGGVIVFFDEADSLGNRGNLSGGGWRPQSSAQSSVETTRWLGRAGRRAIAEQTLATSTEQAMDQVVGVGMGGGGGSGTLQSLLAEMQGLKKPRGFFGRTVRKALGMRPKQPPKYRILIIMATNMPDSLDEAILRPGRIDRLYKVGYPTKEGRKRTYEGYLSKVSHSLSDADIDKLASMTPPRTGAEIKDLVNEALIHSMRENRASIEWNDVLTARYIRQTGLPEGFVYVDWERHAVAIHEACHAVASVALRPWQPIDVATIVRRGDVGGFVSSFDSDEQFTNWKNDFEADICVSLASLAGERLFFSEQNSAGVGGDLRNATSLAYWMLGVYGMGSSLVSLTGRPGGALGDLRPGEREHLDQLVENKLAELYDKVRALLEQRRSDVLAVAHALEVHQTITGDDVVAIMDHQIGPNVDGSVYGDAANIAELERYHRSAADAQLIHGSVHVALPEMWGGAEFHTGYAPEQAIVVGEDVGYTGPVAPDRATTPEVEQTVSDGSVGDPHEPDVSATSSESPVDTAAPVDANPVAEPAAPPVNPTSGWERFGWGTRTRDENDQEDPS